MRVMITFGGGGHTAESLRVLQDMGPGFEYHYLYLADEPSVLDKVPFVGRFHVMARPRHRDDSIPRAIFKVIRSFLRVLRIVLSVRPRAIVGCGPSMSVIAMWAGKLIGARAIYIETAARVRSTSLSAKLAYPIADLFFVQWPEMLEKLPRAEYRGRI